jgi:hypothetical protein
VSVESYPAQSVPPELLSQVAVLREEARPTAGGDRAGWEVLEGAALIGGPPDNPLPGRVARYPGDIDRLW